MRWVNSLSSVLIALALMSCERQKHEAPPPAAAKAAKSVDVTTRQFESPGLFSPAEPGHVSLIQLIARPQDFNGQRVEVIGFYSAEFEGTAIYLHQDDFEHFIFKNSLWVTSMNLNLDGKYVRLAGRFNAARHGHLGLFSGTIEDITLMEPFTWRRTISRSRQPAEGSGQNQ